MYPIVLNVHGRLAAVVGGGAVAERKIGGLLEAGASVRMIAPSATKTLEQLAARGGIVWEGKEFEPGDLDGASLAFAATGDDAVNAAVVAAARERRIFVNDAGDAERGDFATPAIHRSGPLTVAVDSGGASPDFSRRVRDELGAVLDERYARAARALAVARTYLRATLAPAERRQVMRLLAERDLDALAAFDPASMQNEVDEVVLRLRRREAGEVPEVRGTLVCASRASALAMTQTRTVMAKLAVAGISSTVVTITTKGDEVQDRSLAELGSESIFVKELELALREERADYAVHSCKDLPSTLPDDMELAAIGERADPRDVFCSEKYAAFEDLPAGARIGTSSPRRRAQLEALRDDLTYVSIRGNIDTRLRKLRDGEFDAIVLAAAGLARLGVGARHGVPFPPEVLVPAVAQGALAIETRRGDPIAAAIRRALNDPASERAILAERAFLRAMRGGCSAPIGAYATLEGGFMTLRAAAGIEGTTRILHVQRLERIESNGEAEAMGSAVAAELAAKRLESAPLAGRIFLLPRTQDRPGRIAPALREAGAEVLEVHDSRGAREALAGRAPGVILFPSSGAVSAIAEYLDELRARRPRPVVAAMGPASGATAAQHGWTPDVVAPNAEIGAFVASVTRYVLEHDGVTP